MFYLWALFALQYCRNKGGLALVLRLYFPGRSGFPGSPKPGRFHPQVGRHSGDRRCRSGGNGTVAQDQRRKRTIQEHIRWQRKCQATCHARLASSMVQLASRHQANAHVPDPIAAPLRTRDAAEGTRKKDCLVNPAALGAFGCPDSTVCKRFPGVIVLGNRR